MKLILVFALGLAGVFAASAALMKARFGLSVSEWIQRLKISKDNPFVIWSSKKVEESRRK